MTKRCNKLYQHKSSWGSKVYTVLAKMKKAMGRPQVWNSRASLFLTLFPASSVHIPVVAVWPLTQFEDAPASRGEPWPLGKALGTPRQ